MKESYSNWGERILVLRCKSIESNVDNLTIKSLNITLDKNDDWKIKEKIDQSNVAIAEVLSQFNESESHIWSDSV